MGPFTVDASVFLNAFNPYEKGHEDSYRFLERLQEAAVPVVVPTLLLPEVAGTISRGRRDAALAREFASAVSRLPRVVFIALDTPLAQKALEVAAEHRLRGSDAIYATVALQFGSTLVTLDREQHDRVAKIVPTRWPSEAISS